MKHLFLRSFFFFYQVLRSCFLLQEDIENFSMEEIRLDEKIRCVSCLKSESYVFIFINLIF